MLTLRKYIPYAIVQLNRVMKQEILKTSRISFCSESSESKNKRKPHDQNKDLPALSSSFESISEKTKEAYLDMVTILKDVVFIEEIMLNLFMQH